MTASAKTEHPSIEAICSALPQGSKPSGHFGFRSLKEQTASDLGFSAALKILETSDIDRSTIGAIIYVGASPDYRSPATACVLQYRLGLEMDCVAFDMNISGCGFVYALQLGSSLLQSQNMPRVLMIIGDTPSKWLPENYTGDLKWSDAATAVLMNRSSVGSEMHLELKMKSSDFPGMMLREGGFRKNKNTPKEGLDNLTEYASRYAHLQMNEESFRQNAQRELSELAHSFFSATGEDFGNFDILALPQLGPHFERGIAEKLNLTENGILSNYSDFGYALGSSVPLLLSEQLPQIKTGKEEIKVLAFNYGEGISYALASFYLKPESLLQPVFTDQVFAEGAIDHKM